MPPKRRRRFQGLYYHSSPPKVLPMNGQMSSENGRKRREPDDFSVKLSTIRIWMHEKDIGKLTRILWAGQGNRLRQQASTNPRVKRFLAAVPHVMNAIKDVHQAVVDNNLETLQTKLEPPVPPALITCRDANGLNVIHKAAGLGHTKILEYLIESWPDGAHETDITGKTPLHWAASAKNNMRCYTLLTQAGCDEEALDYKTKSPSYYRHKPNEIERAFLVYVPEAPRVAANVDTDWEALSEDDSDGKKLDIKIPDTNGYSGRTDGDDSIDNNSEADLGDGADEEMPKATPETPVENDDESPMNTPSENVNIDEAADVADDNGTAQVEDEEAANGGEDSNEQNISKTLNESTANNGDNIEQQTCDENAEDIQVPVVESVCEQNDDEHQVPEKEIVAVESDQDDVALGQEEVSKAVYEENESGELNNKDQVSNKEEETMEGVDNENSNFINEQIEKIEVFEEQVIEDMQKELIDKSEVNSSDDQTIDEPATIAAEIVDIANKVKDSISNLAEKVTDKIGNAFEDIGNLKKQVDFDSDTANEEETVTEKTEVNMKAYTDEELVKNARNVVDDVVNAVDNIVEDQKENVEEEGTKKSEYDDHLEQATGECLSQSGSDANKRVARSAESRKSYTATTTGSVDSYKDDVESKQIENETEGENEEEVDDDDEDDMTGNDEAEPTLDEDENLAQPADIENEQPTADDENDDDGTDEATENSINKDNANSNFDDTPTSSLAIEGYVLGDPEDNTVQSQSTAHVNEGKTIEEIITAGNMESLAQIVLNGDGAKLLDMKSPEPEIQAFLNNVPNYMNKIRRVHEAARSGSLLSLQQALDRRKFAIAKDEISPNGASPLHVGVLFGHSDIVRYLAARFPETMTLTDNDGRTALHYAATIKDNGHFYNVLTQLGADPKAVDKLGHMPEFYLDNEEAKDILTYRQLLSAFGAEHLEEELLSDQVPDDLHSSRRLIRSADIVRTLDRCFSVILESSKVLSGATASALAQRKPLSASSVQLTVTSYLSRFLKPSVYEKIKLRQTRLDHNLFDVIWPSMRKTSKIRHLEEDINCGVVAPDFDVFVVFQEFLVPLIKDMHCLNIAADFKPHPRLAYFPMESGERMNTASLVFDDEAKLIQRCLVECSRNLEAFELPLNLTIGQVEQAERMLMGRIFTSGFAEAIGEKESGSYYTLTEILEENSEIQVMLTTLGLMIPILDLKNSVLAAENAAFNGNLWPYGRGVYLNSDNNLALWINCQEHLRIISVTNSSDPANMGAAYTRVGRAVTYLEKQLHFKESYLLGYLQSRPAYLGTGLKFTTILRLPNLMKEMDNLRHLCSVRGLNLVTNLLSKLTVRLINMQSLGEMEYVLFQDYCTAITNILSLEKDMSLSNSKHIASMLVKIFRRKKNSIIDRN